MNVNPLVNCHITNWKDPPCLMGKLTISMAIFNSYVSLPKGADFRNFICFLKKNWARIETTMKFLFGESFLEGAFHRHPNLPLGIPTMLLNLRISHCILVDIHKEFPFSNATSKVIKVSFQSWGYPDFYHPFIDRIFHETIHPMLAWGNPRILHSSLWPSENHGPWLALLQPIQIKNSLQNHVSMIINDTEEIVESVLNQTKIRLIRLRNQQSEVHGEIPTLPRFCWAFQQIHLLRRQLLILHLGETRRRFEFRRHQTMAPARIFTKKWQFIPSAVETWGWVKTLVPSEPQNSW